MEEGLSTSWIYCSGSGSSTTRDMIEQAKEELQILETQHPNRFNYLKLELKSFISHLESQNLLISSDNNNMNMVSSVNSASISVSSSVTTQESSAGKKRKNGDSGDRLVMESSNIIIKIDAAKQKFQRVAGDSYSKRRDRVDVVVEKAKACLQKIQQFKTSFT